MNLPRIGVFVPCLLLALGSGAVASAQATNFVTNPTFAPTTPLSGQLYEYDPSVSGPPYPPESATFDVPGWTFSPLVPGVSGSGIAGYGSAFGFTSALSGALQVGFVQQLAASISQSITGLTPGDIYDLTFNLEGRPSTGAPPTTVTIGMGGSPVFSGIPSNNTWTSYSDTFIASSSTEVLTFSSDGTADTTTGIDDPSITLVPEGGAALLYVLLAGGACFGAMFFSRNRFANLASA